MDHIDNQSECAGLTQLIISANVADAMSVIRQIRFILLNPVLHLNIFQDFVEIVYDNTCRNLRVCRVALCREYNKRICERKYSMPVSELYAYSYIMRI